MAFQIVINLIIACMWMFLSESYSVPSFIAGYILGILLLLLLRRFVPDTFYLRRVMKILRLIMLFIKELFSSNMDIVKLVYTPKPDIEPGIFELPTELKSNWEITLLANLISLTPGTLSVAVSRDNTKLFIHAMDIDDSDESIQSIKNTFEKAIMEVTR
ncbi:MAG: Na+/H+ antiporter subunit E [Bacillota bacterium]|uniref:Na+/H+ antiporter subunit E n=1 Tax=Virgibacillus salarius TaxID=447199 RepID=A0A941DU73_9BACI|nr:MULTISPECIES: Na+/H+ antiporter subunit E [Bacillaceae]NAZ10029.1 Na+/H+ antiporter subunit E [Agaribacter marinus]MBR7797319.1 Na+/H+ antiporter subunit E [Virgibacillus salarius]MCC2250239.1 Na+/H+ antiporter subunit E [Virgibacillus sp. AGTR]MDY7044604.1 Na+/H+ antiporter subunit E [Virgibacillus sp. M23]QRZ17489.1 Na+/H+ antiporter subunit E [Virgibacillus sp. AGTR]